MTPEQTNMKILAIGGTGNVGSGGVTELLKRGEAAMQGADKLFLLNAVVADELTQALIAYGIAKRIGLKQVNAD